MGEGWKLGSPVGEGVGKCVGTALSIARNDHHPTIMPDEITYVGVGLGTGVGVCVGV